MSSGGEDPRDRDDPGSGSAPSSTGGLPGRARVHGSRLNRRNALVLGAVAAAAAVPLVARRREVPGRPADPEFSPAPAPSITPSVQPSLDLRDLGARGDGIADDTAAVQALIDGSADADVVGRVPAGTYRCTSSLLVPAGARLQLDPGSRLSRDWAAPPGLAEAFIRNADFAVPSHGVRISGPGTIGAPDHSRTGVVLALYGDEVQLSDFTIDTYAGGQAVMFAGDRGRIDRVRVVNSAAETGTGGIRVIGGRDFRASECHVESGDDCLQFVPIGDPGALLHDMDIAGGSFVGCTGSSSVSRFMVALLEWTGGDTAMTASVTDCSFQDCHGAANHRGIVVKNTHSAGAVERLAFTDCSVDLADGGDPRTQGVRVQTGPASGGAIRDVVFTRTRITRPGSTTLRVGGPGISGLTFDRCAFAAPSGVAPVTAVVDSAEAVALRRCTFSGTAGTTHLAVGPGEPVHDLTVEDCRFSDIGSGAWAVELVAVIGARVSGSVFRAASDAPGARAIRITPQSREVLVEDNDLSALAAATAITDLASDTVVQGNRGA